MQMFPTSVRGKLIVGFGLLTVITLILGVADYRTMIDLDRSADEMERKSLKRTLTDEIYQASGREGNSVRGFLLIGYESMLEADADRQTSIWRSVTQTARANEI